MIRLSLLLLAILLSGCAGVVEQTKSAGKSIENNIIEMLDFSGGDGSTPPRELEEISNEVVITEVWKQNLIEGQGDDFLKLELAVSEDKVFVADREGLVLALDKESGEKVWEVETELPISGGLEIGGDKLFFGTTDAEVVALTLADGDTAWTSQVSSEVLSIPRFSENFLVIRSIDGAITALNTDEGKEVWSYIRDVPALSLRGTSSPVLKSGGVISGYANGQLVVLRLADGAQIWETSVAIPRGRGALSRMVDVDADPVAGDRYIYAATFNGGVAAVDVGSGQIAWRRAEMSSYKTMVADWISLYVVDVNNHVWSADHSNGQINWQQDSLENRRLTALTKLGDYLLTADFEGYLHILSASDGHLMGRMKVSDTAITAPPVVDGDLIYIQDIDGEITALQLNAELELED
jgi:outer membrane protein assembly factor BamB